MTCKNNTCRPCPWGGPSFEAGGWCADLSSSVARLGSRPACGNKVNGHAAWPARGRRFKGLSQSGGRTAPGRTPNRSQVRPGAGSAHKGGPKRPLIRESSGGVLPAISPAGPGRCVHAWPVVGELRNLEPRRGGATYPQRRSAGSISLALCRADCAGAVLPPPLARHRWLAKVGKRALTHYLSPFAGPQGRPRCSARLDAKGLPRVAARATMGAK
eukprot:scaffold2838_cov376-Prasinococcus_capsulatus_cf.AAC.4